MGDSNRDVRTAGRTPTGPTREHSGGEGLANVPALIFRRCADPPHPFVWIRGDCDEIAGRSSEALEGDCGSWWDGVPPAERARALGAIARARLGGSVSYRIVYAYATPGRSRRWLLEEARGVFDRDAGALGFEGIIVDVTDEYRALQQLPERGRRFRALTEHAGDAICEASDSGQILYASPRFEEILGHPKEFLGAVEASTLVHPEDGAVVERMRAEFEHGDSFGPTRVRVRHRDGGWRWIEATARRFSSGENERRVAVVVRDVTEHQQARERLEEQLARETRIADLSRRFLALGARQIEDGLRESMAVVAALAEADRSWLFAFDGSRHAIAGIYEWCAAGEQPHADRVRDATRHRFPWSYEPLARGEVLHVPDAAKLPPEAAVEREEMLRRDVGSMLGIPLLFEDRLIGYLGFETLHRVKTWSSESITILRLVGEILMSALRRKRAEEDLFESQMQLLQAQKLEAVGTLAGGIAHDFNNQLTVMLGNARYVQSHIEQIPNLRDAMLDLTRSAEHCVQLTRSLLAFSRRSTVSARSLDVANVVSQTRELIEPLIPSSIRLEVAPGAGVEPAFADPIQLQQVLVNLVVNARDALPEGGEIRVATANRRIDESEALRVGLRRPGDYVEIAVSDDGVGMDEAVRQRVFEPFFTTKAPGEGTGLGLATAYGIVQESGGAIEIASAPGRGTTIRVLLRRASSAPEPREPQRAPEFLGGSETLLLVEDSASVRRFIARVLGERGYTVLEAENGPEGLRLGQQRAKEIDALVTDLDMPGLDGLDLARRLRRARPSLPVLLLSGYSRDGREDLLASLGGARFLQKPFGEETLLAELRGLLDGARAISAGTAAWSAADQRSRRRSS